ncbi:hypothetical protein HanIR_Chr01g0037171 [Helianthus annuus]|nr:hypothetical protein HanIR_Chr01g0037171 [Helianthus annuus]
MHKNRCDATDQSNGEKIYEKMLNPTRTLRCVNSQNLERNENLGKMKSMVDQN